MKKPEFPRSFSLPLPLFANYGGAASPWNQAIQEFKSNKESEKQERVTYDIFKAFSEAKLQTAQAELQTMIENGQQGTDAFVKLEEDIKRQEQKLDEGGAGASQFPHMNHDDYSFPIYPVKRDANGNVVTAEIPLQPYYIDSFPSPWYPSGGDQETGFTAREVPQPAGCFRPGKPEGVDSDGNIILYDEQTKTEYDFWQVTSKRKDGKTTGGGTLGDAILATGSVARFQVTRIGARHPEIEPSGSARATGLPYLGGLLLPEDLAEGARSKIKHALIFAIPRLRYSESPQCAPNWVYPATRTEFSNGIPNPHALAAGQRIGLQDVLHGREGFQDGTSDLIKDQSLPPIVRIFLEALYHYGAYLVDGAGGFAFAAEDIHTAHISEDLAKELTGVSSLDDEATPWQAVLELLNEYLFGKLLNQSGLAFAYNDDTNGFRSNFRVAEELTSFYRGQC